LASKAVNEKSGARKSGGKKENTRSSERSASEASGVLMIAGGILATAYLFFSAAGYLGEVMGKALFGLIGIIAYALPVILIVVGVLYIRGGATGRLAGSGWYLLLGILALVTLFQTIRDTPYEGVEYMTILATHTASARRARRRRFYRRGAELPAPAARRQDARVHSEHCARACLHHRDHRFLPARFFGKDERPDR
jgi:hypothetical protein